LIYQTIHKNNTTTMYHQHNMKTIFFVTKLLLVTISLWYPISSQAQQNPFINDIITEVNIDGMIAEVRVFSGEDSTFVNGTKVLMKNRATTSGRNLSADYIFQKLESLGLSPVNQVYSTGRNIYAIQEGQVNPDNIYIACGHFDAVANYCADDNGSGVTLTLEAARIFSNYTFKNTVVYAFWDQEEIGLVGSEYYADWAASNDLNILGVLNFETLAWDSDNDFAFDIHANTDPSTTAIVNAVEDTKDIYNLIAVPGIFDSSPQTSDQASFWQHGFGAIAFGGALYSNGGDLNPYYHTSNDRVEHFNLTYFHEMGKLGLATLASLAVPVGTTVVEDVMSSDNINVSVYPNPSTGKLNINVEDAEIQTILLMNLQGREVAEVHNNFNSIDIQNTCAGYYIIQISTDKGIIRKPIIKK